MQGLGKTVTIIGLLVSNRVEPEREWGRVKVDLNAPKRKRLKWENHKAPLDKPSTPDANGCDANCNAADGIESAITRDLEGLQDEASPAQPVMQTDTPKKVCVLCSAA